MHDLIIGIGRAVRFLLRQAESIRTGGVDTFVRKIRKLLVIASAMPFVLVVRALRPLVLVRFGPIRSERIGHFALNTELYLCRRDTEMPDRRTVDIFYHNPLISNHQLKKMYDRTLRVSQIAAPLDMVNRMLPGWKRHVIPIPVNVDPQGLLARTQAHLSFTALEKARGQESLRHLGVEPGSPFVCMCARDTAYLDKLHLYNSRSEWSYHDYRDSDIFSYVPAAEELVRRGYHVLRMGAIVERPLSSAISKIIDYANNGRNDFLDIYLGANCLFFLGDTGGLSNVAAIFRVPLAIANSIPLEYSPTLPGLNDIFIPKKLWLREERRFFRFREILASGAGRFLHTGQFEQLGLEIIDNTAEEITAIAVEMDERLKGIWRTTEEDEELQNRFRSLFKPSHVCGNRMCRIGAEFLRQNRELLE